MKKLQINSRSYNYLLNAFTEWLDILGYNRQSLENMPNIIREFLHFLEGSKIHHITGLHQDHYKKYYDHISSRSNHTRGGGLSNNYINKHIQALEKFHQFLVHKGATEVPPVTLRQLKLESRSITVLTQDEIRSLYEVSKKESSNRKEEALSARDRAMLTIYYGCGLRRNEGVHVSVDHIDLDRRILHVKKGKNYKERFVPLSKQGGKYIQEWIYDHRIDLIKSKQESALFIGNTGECMSGSGLYQRLKKLQQKIDDPIFQQKNIGLHTLRHSIATHLLQNGMELTKIQRFLGHSSLESTQIYTHLIDEQL